MFLHNFSKEDKMTDLKRMNQFTRIMGFYSLMFLCLGLVLIGLHFAIFRSTYPITLLAGVFCLVLAWVFYSKIRIAKEEYVVEGHWEVINTKVSDLLKLRELLNQFPVQVAGLRETLQEEINFLQGQCQSGESTELKQQRQEKICQMQELLTLL